MRESESERVSWFSSQMPATAGASLGQSQELHPGLPRGWKVRPQCLPGCASVGSWTGGRVSGTCPPVALAVCNCVCVEDTMPDRARFSVL